MGEVWGGAEPPPGTRGKMRVCSTVLQTPPKGHRPNDMVNRVCNLPYGRSSGVLWGSGGVREVLGWIGGVQGGIEGVPGRFLRSPGGPLEKVIFSFWGMHL